VYLLKRKNAEPSELLYTLYGGLDENKEEEEEKIYWKLKKKRERAKNNAREKCRVRGVVK
jgi:hypothetical protein